MRFTVVLDILPVALAPWRTNLAAPRVALALLSALTAARQAFAQPAANVRDETTQGPGEEPVSRRDKDPIRGSTFLFDQSLSTQAAHLEPSPQLSYVPFYGWWLSLRPRWNFTDELFLSGRFDYYKEFTNSQDTTYYREDLFGDIWTDLVYSRYGADQGSWHNTKLTLGTRALWPTSKLSQGQGTYVTLAAFGGVKQKVPIRGEDAKVLNSARFGLSLSYLHPFTAATTPTQYAGFAYVRQNVEGFSFISDQLTGQTIVNHTLYAILEGALQITPKLDLTLDAIWINQWHYLPSDATVSTLTGPVSVGRTNDQQFTQLVWDVATLDYELFDEVSLGLGYYNLTNVIALDGTVRSPFAGGQDNLFWSPDARVFFDVTANLDRIYERLTGRYEPRATSATPPARETAEVAREARRARLGIW